MSVLMEATILKVNNLWHSNGRLIESNLYYFEAIKLNYEHLYLFFRL